jgi:DNA-binding MarR family transcriptional regulator
LNFGAVMPAESFSERDLQILEHIESNPDATQSTLAEELGVAVGTVNFVVRRMIEKGYIRVKRLERKRLKYIVTPQGIAIRAKLAMISIEYSMRLYREIRAEAQRLLTKVKRSGKENVFIEGKGEVAEVVWLTCLEQNLKVLSHRSPEAVPTIIVVGSKLSLKEAD